MLPEGIHARKYMQDDYEADSRIWHAKNMRFGLVLLGCLGFWALITAAFWYS